MKKTTILLTGSGGPGGPGIIKSLRLVKERKIRIIGTDMEKNSVANGLVDIFYVVPPADDANFIEEVLKISIKEKIDVILPLNTGELLKFSENKNKFEEKNTKISVSDPQGLKIANNKFLLMEHCKKINVPVPEFYSVKSVEEFLEKAKKLGYSLKKICVKPPISNGSRGLRILDANLDRVKIFLKEKPTTVFATLEDIISILKSVNPFPELLVMEYLPGKEYSVDVLADNGKPLIVIPRTRDKIKMGVSFAGTIVNEKNIIKYCNDIVKTLKLNGNIGFQFKEDDNGNPKVIESNPRLQGTIVLNTAAGVNLPYLAVKLALGEKIKIPSVKWGVKMIRYWDEKYYNKKGKSFNF